MYRCNVCRAVSKPHEPRKVHTVYRTNIKGHQEIAQEVPVCGKCQALLNGGEATLVQLRRVNAPEPVLGKSILEAAIPAIKNGEQTRKSALEVFAGTPVLVATAQQTIQGNPQVATSKKNPNKKGK